MIKTVVLIVCIILCLAMMVFGIVISLDIPLSGKKEKDEKNDTDREGKE
ncbi:MAG: hypothetical protein J6F31_00505 [Oscillospiraceae bacterium]|nr:hypothetical protein [Oscillospiraceae bacterium]